MRSTNILSMIILLLFSCSLAFSGPKENAEETRLTMGEYAVGFRSVTLFDYSRTFRARMNYKGERIPGETARPIQVNIWYPARRSQKEPMRVADYVHLMGSLTRPGPPSKEDKDDAVRIFKWSLNRAKPEQQVTDAIVNRLLAEKRNAVFNAQALEGPFPIVMGAGAHQAYANALFCEFLASRGFVVAAPANLGKHGRRTDSDVIHAEIMARDREFAMAWLRDFPHADFEHVAFMDYGFGAAASYLSAMRNMQVDALISMAGWNANSQGVALLEKSPWFAPYNLRMPILHMAGDQYNKYQDFSLLDRTRYADRFILEIEGFSNQTFLSSNSMLGLSKLEREKFELSCIYAYNFLKAYLKGDAKSRHFFEKRPTDLCQAGKAFKMRRLTAKPAPPTESEFLGILEEENGLDQGMALFQTAWQREPGRPVFSERQVNRFGYMLLRSKRLDDAIEIFKWNMLAYPDSSNVYDSLAEAYMVKGEMALAIRFYNKSLDLNPENLNAVSMLKELGEPVK